MRTDKEFADYHLRYTDDPVVRRLCEIILNDNKVIDLEDEIDHLKNDVDYAERQLKEARYEIKILEARTIEDMAADLVNRVSSAESIARNAREERDRIAKKNRELEEKINVWHIMEA